MSASLIITTGVLWYRFVQGGLPIDFGINSSIFGILLAAQIIFLFSTFLSIETLSLPKPRLLKFLILILCVESFPLLIVSDSRSAWIGLMASLVILGVITIRKRKLMFATLAVFLGGLSIFCLLFYKQDSTSGRVHIYKVSGEVAKSNLLWGVKGNSFRAEFNEAQARYFLTSGIDSKEAILADGASYVFNDYFQILIEHGLLVFILFFILAYLIVRDVLKRPGLMFSNSLLLAVSMSLLCLSIAAFFSYPFQIWSLSCFAVICLAIVHSLVYTESQRTYKAGRIVTVLIPVLLAIGLVIHSVFEIKYRVTSNRALELSMSGSKSQALMKYSSLSGSYINDGEVLLLYSRQLYYSNNLSDALKYLQIAKSTFNDYQVHSLEGQIYCELKMNKQAELSLRKSVYIRPNRMRNRYDLMSFYLEMKDTVQAKFWANSILKMPIKVKSAQADTMLSNTRRILTGIQY